MSKKIKRAAIGSECVACGCCVKICPLGALWIHNGITATIDEKKCIGCGKCAAACPAGIISIVEA